MKDGQNLPTPMPQNAAIPLPAPVQRILVVDDNKDIRQLSVDALKESGYEVDGVKDGVAGWEALQENYYDLIITDNQMPRMTGIRLLEELRFARMSVPTIMHTSHLPAFEFARKPWLRPNAFLQSPCSNDDLLATVKKVLSESEGDNGLTKTLLPNYL